MKNVLLAVLLVGMAQSAFALSSLYSKVECNVEDQTCNKLILDMGRQEAVTRIISGDQGELNLVLQQAVDLHKAQNNDAGLSDEQVVQILASEQK